MARRKERPLRITNPEPAPVVRLKPAFDWRPHLFAIATIWVLALAAYANSFGGELSFDSQVIVHDDPRLRAATSQNISQIWSRGYWYDNADPTLYRPLTTLSYLFNYSVLGNGARPAGYHWINFLLHAIDALLVYCLGMAVFRDIGRSAALAALWAVHPVLTESVTYVVGRADMLAAFGVLAGLLCHVKAQSEAGRRKLAWLAGLAAAAAIGIFSKESAVVLIAVMMAYDLAFAKKGIKANLPAYAAAVLPVGVFLYERFQALSKLPVGVTLFVNNPLLGLGFWSARFTALQVIGRYMLLILWPQRLSCDYSFNQIPLFRGTFTSWGDWAAVLGLLACLAVAGLAAFWYRRNRPGFFFIALFFIALAPVANIALLIGTIMAERLLYLPAVGLVGCVVWAVYAGTDRLKQRWPGAAIDPRWVLGVLCLALVVRTHLRNTDWESSQALFESAAQVSPRSYKNHLNLAVSFFKIRGKTELAVVEGERSLAVLDSVPPGQVADPSAYSNIGAIYRAEGERLAKEAPDSAASRQWYQKSLDLLQRGILADRSIAEDAARRNEAAGRPRFIFGTYQIYQELAKTYIKMGDYQNALQALDYGSVIRPDLGTFQIMVDAYTAANDQEGAALALMEGQVIHPDEKAFASELVALYLKKALSSCAVNQGGGSTSLNLDCPLVHDHLCEATRRVRDLYTRRGDTPGAENVRVTAVQSFGCPAQ